MSGGLMQLVAYGAQDVYLTGNPQITFFKVVYRRHTNFSMEAIEQTLTGSVSFGSTVTATVSRNGDLVGRMYVEMDPSSVMSDKDFAPNLCHNVLEEMEVEIGGQRIDRHYNHWLNVWTELTEQTNVNILRGGKYDASAVVNSANDTLDPYNEVSLPPSAYQRMAHAVKSDGVTAPKETYAAVPLQFWFCRNPGLALPLIALQYHEVKIKLKLAAASGVLSAGSNSGDLSSLKLWADYIYLDTDERKRFAQVSHEYLIEQLQYQSEGAGTSFTLNFNHPVKELIWAGKRSGVNKEGGPANVSDLMKNDESAKLADTTVTTTLKLNGQERFAPRLDGYFTRTQPWQHHSHPGGGVKQDAIHVYSFALKPEEHQPSGTCNFSRIDTAQLVFSDSVAGSGKDVGLHIWAVNYNVLRVMSGMGGLAYSN